MSREALNSYSHALRARRQGQPSNLGGDASFPEAKPEFYADARMLINAVRQTYAGYRTSYSPHGLIDHKSTAASPWTTLESSMHSTAQRAFDETRPAADAFPYHEALRNLGEMPVKVADGATPGEERLRRITAPGALFAPATIVNLLRHVPAMAAVTGASRDLESLARASDRSLLQEPLHHPQQYARPFIFTLAEGTPFGMRRNTFLPDDLIKRYVQLDHTVKGQEVLGWSGSTLDFTLRSEVPVADRLAGPENDTSGEHVTVYPIGTRLGDITVTEPTIGCPGNQMAYEMWAQAIDVVVAEKLWERF